MNVADIMSSPVYVIKTDETVSHARKLMLRHRIGTLPVLNEGKMVGIVTKSDISNRLSQAEPLWKRRPIDQIPIKMLMTETVITIYPEASITQAATLMLENGIHNVPVVKNGNIVGILTRTDFMRYIAENAGKMSIKIRNLMTEDVISVHRHHTINHVIDEMNKNEIARVIVKDDDGKSVGYISRRSIALSLITDSEGDISTKSIKMVRRSSPGGQKTYRYVKQMPVTAEDIMVSPVISIDVNENISAAAKKMIEEGLTGLPVSDGEDIVGILSRTDIMRAIL
jgi:CBS domain-containing protein